MERRLRYGRLLAALWRRLPLPSSLRGAVLSAINTRFLVGTVGVIQDEHGRILLCHHTYRPDVAWGLPGGYLQDGEEPTLALAREIAEETGLVVRRGPLIAVVSWPGESHLDLAFHARLAGGTFQPSTEVSAVRWAPPYDVGVLSPKDRHVLALAFRHPARECT